MIPEQTRRYAAEMLGISGMTPEHINATGDALAKLLPLFFGDTQSESTTTTTNNGTSPQVVVLPSQTERDNTIIYVGMAALVAIAALFAFKKK